jgi:hypothetical protein
MLTTKRPWWDKVAFVVVPYFGAQGTYWYLTQHCSLGWGLPVAIAVVVAGLLLVGCSLILDKLRQRFGQ